MVEKEVEDLLLEEMRNTEGFKIVLHSLREKYLNLVRGSYTYCSKEEDLIRVKAKITTIQDVLEITGISKEDVKQWMEIR